MTKTLLFMTLASTALLLTACGGSDCKLTRDDSIAIYKDWSKRFSFTAAPQGAAIPKKVDSLNTVHQAFLKLITKDEAISYIYNYHNSPLDVLRTQDPTNPRKTVLIKAFELESMLIDSIRNNPNIQGLRLYLGKRPDSMYTLVIIPKDVNNENMLDINSIFDWNNPCPPYCPPAAQTLGDKYP